MNPIVVALLASTISMPHGGTVSGDLMTGDIPAPGWHWIFQPPHNGLQFVGFVGPGFWNSTPGSPDLFETGTPEANEIGYVYTSTFGCCPGLHEVEASAQPDSFLAPHEVWEPYSGIVTIIAPATFTDLATGESGSFDVTFTVADFSFIVGSWGVGDPAAIIGAAAAALTDSVVRIGPDPLFDLSFWVMNTGFQGSFDAMSDLTGIHNVALFAVPITPSVPEPSTWIMMLAGFAVLRKARSGGLAGLPTSRAHSSLSFSAWRSAPFSWRWSRAC